MRDNKKLNFNNRTIKALPNCLESSAARSDEYSDTVVTGLKMVVGKTGTKTFGFRYKRDGRAGYVRIGTFPGIEVAEARQRALALRADVDRGIDPQAERERIRATPTFGEFVEEQYLPWATTEKRSVGSDRSKLDLHVLPRFKSRRLDSITRHEIELYRAEIRTLRSPSTANRHLALLSAIFRQALHWEVVDRNPCLGIKQFKENAGRTRFLSQEEVSRLFAAMASEPNRTAVAALKLLLLTGVRREEALQAKWEDVDLDNSSWRLPRTKNGRVRMVALNDSAKALLSAQASRGTSVWVFPGRDPAKPLNNPRKAFTRVLAAAGISEHVRIHDLRHSFASLAVNAGVPLFTVQNLLGHSSAQMTQRYAHLADETLRKASQLVADQVSAAIGAAEQAAA
ncbi:Site-specific recombinase XerD [Solimonas aquatica]|uniref:Site-specific recombinase XerD n=1 Tax=Solimonas aquatica TaxID=489703 RepID=A0A1H9GI51_9GAMM|nr:site-specific integrase [Solimonas aquatica]SEQ49762.1 Site-specific recombinase XerD [Solimonas aquatica]